MSCEVSEFSESQPDTVLEFYSNKRVSECRNQFFEERYWKIFKISISMLQVNTDIWFSQQ